MAIPGRRLRPTYVVSIAIIVGFVLIGIFAPWIMPHDPTEFLSYDPFEMPSATSWLGTDYLGRDLLSRLIDGTFITLAMAFTATCLALLIGGSLGLLAAAQGGLLDTLLSRIVDVLLSLPKIIVGLVVVAALGPSVSVIVVVAAVVYASGVFRLARALAQDLINKDFIQVARSRGEGLAWILFGEILPHVIRPLAADFAIRMAFAILFLSSLSFLGLGVQPPLSDWGGMVRENLQGLSSGSLAPVYPALAIASMAVALNLLVDTLAERQDEGTMPR
jgi:peptide/nickel transport system permease protein